MSAGEREVIYHTTFLEEVIAVEEYKNQGRAGRGRRFTSVLFDFTLNVIGSHPWAYPEYEGKPTAKKAYRKALFQREYVILYKVSDARIDFLLMYHTSRNPDSIQLPEN